MIVFAIGIIGYIGKNTDWTSTMKSIKSANMWMILCGSLSMFFAHYLRAYRWKMLSEASGKPINIRRAFYSVMTGYMVDAATSRGGEVARCALTAKSEKVPVETMVGTVITERIMDLTTLVGMCIICFFSSLVLGIPIMI